MKVPLTHKGWFGLCPVYFGGIFDKAPLVVQRHWAFAPLMGLSLWMFEVSAFCLGVMSPSCRPMFKLRITGKLQPGRVADLPAIGERRSV